MADFYVMQHNTRGQIWSFKPNLEGFQAIIQRQLQVDAQTG
jgi:hypothetical protein